MFDEEARDAVASILVQRIHSDQIDLDMDESEAIVLYLSEVASLDLDKARALLLAEEADLTPQEIERLAGAFDLHHGLLSCSLVPTSLEIIEANLAEVARNYLVPARCSRCAELTDDIEQLDELDDEELYDLVFACLEHVLAAESDERYEEHEEQLDPREQELRRLYGMMDDEARTRLLAFAYAQLAQEESLAPSRMEALARLRDKRLSQLAVRVLDELAGDPAGVLTIDELKERLGLENRRALGQVPRSVRRAVQDLAERGLRLDTELLLVHRKGQQIIFELPREYQMLWRGLIRAGHSPRISRP